MSSPYVIVAAVHEPEESIQEWWKNYRQNLDNLDEWTDHNDEVDWYMCEGEFKSSEARETFPVKASYHSGRGENVIEIILEGRDDIQSIQRSGLEDIIDEINFRFESDFTLEVYYWYSGVDKPGGVDR